MDWADNRTLLNMVKEDNPRTVKDLRRLMAHYAWAQYSLVLDVDKAKKDFIKQLVKNKVSQSKLIRMKNFLDSLDTFDYVKCETNAR